MPVWSEPGRYVVNFAPGILQINQAINAGTIMRIATTAQQVAESLVSLAVDADNCIRAYCNANMFAGNPMQAPQGSDNDPWDLVLRLVYYAHLVLDTVRNGLLPFAGGIQGGRLYAAINANMHTIMLAAYLAAGHLRNTPLHQLGNDQELINFTNTLNGTNMAGNLCPAMSGLGTVELLCRIVARGCNNMNTFRARAQQLRISQLQPPQRAARLGWWDCYHKAIPKTVFVCTGSNGALAGNPAKIVVTTSQDEWGAFNIMQNFATRCRQPLRRLDWNALGGGPRDPLGIRHQSINLRILYHQADAAILPPVTANARRNARQQVIANWNHNANHFSERATPLTCPGFQPKARCLRCQAFFLYDVQPNGVVIPLELALLGARHLKSHLALACAECIAHYACCEAKLNGGFNDANGQLTH